MMIYYNGVSFSLCVMKNDHFLNFVKARFGCVLFCTCIFQNRLMELLHVFFHWDLWMGGQRVAKKGLIGPKFPPKGAVITQKAQKKSRKPIKRLQRDHDHSFEKNPKSQITHSNAGEKGRNETKRSFNPIRAKRQGPKSQKMSLPELYIFRPHGPIEAGKGQVIMMMMLVLRAEQISVKLVTVDSSKFHALNW